MKNKSAIITAFLLIVALVNHFQFISTENMRIVESLSSFAVGVLTAVLILEIARVLKERKKQESN